MNKGDSVHSKKQGSQGAAGVVGRIAPASKLQEKKRIRRHRVESSGEGGLGLEQELESPVNEAEVGIGAATIRL